MILVLIHMLMLIGIVLNQVWSIVQNINLNMQLKWHVCHVMMVIIYNQLNNVLQEEFNFVRSMILKEYVFNVMMITYWWKLLILNKYVWKFQHLKIVCNTIQINSKTKIFYVQNVPKDLSMSLYLLMKVYVIHSNKLIIVLHMINKNDLLIQHLYVLLVMMDTIY